MEIQREQEKKEREAERKDMEAIVNEMKVIRNVLSFIPFDEILTSKVNGQADLLSIYQGFVADRDLIAEFRDSIQGQKVEENEVDEENVVDKIEKIEQKKEVAGDTLKLDCAKKEAFADLEI